MLKTNSYYQKITTYIVVILTITLIIFYPVIFHPELLNKNIIKPFISNSLALIIVGILLCGLTTRIIIKDRKIILNIFFFIPIRKIKIENLRQMEQRSITLLCTTFDGNKSRIVMFPDVSNRERFLAELKEINSSIDANNIH